ncbi:MAG: hypothetical protein J7497_02370 [Chitinophagaceae bacterium]|nr:hypothetical protein [Chitinophagaceae bacterium]
MSLLQRAAAPTPKFFKTLKTIGLTLAAVSGGLLAAPVALPAIITTIASYLGLAAGVLSAVSQFTVESEPSIMNS